MKTLWQQLKPEHKKTIKTAQEKYESAPQKMEETLKQSNLFGELTVEQMRDLFIWTNQDLIDIKWSDVYGDRFFIKK
tara:strand:+ start:592 stop:822 length:231 start_codon:yes stop_codon:yes gene_type:complete